MTKKQVFLGGSCDPTTWRTDVAIPTLRAAGIEFFNPQVAEWSEACVANEAAAKADADVLLFVVDGQTRAVASMLEAVEYAHRGRKVVVAFADIPDGATIAGQAITGRELKDLNRARVYCRDSIARAPRVRVAASIPEAVQAAIDLLHE